MGEDNTSERPSTTWLAIEDYFNSYLPGIIWVADVLVLFYNFPQKTIDNDQTIVANALKERG